MYDFGRECLATKRFDTAVPDELYNAVWAISESDGEVGIWRQPGVYRDLRGLFEGGAAEPSRAKDIAGIRTREAAVAWRCGAYDDARRLLDKLDGSIAPQDGGNTVFEYVYGTPSSWALGEVYAATGPLASQVRKAEALYEASEASAALPIFKRALQDNTDQRAASYLRARVETCRIESELAGDKWVALATSLDALRVENGQWERGSDGSIIAPKPQGWETLVCAARMPRNFEVRAQVDLKPAGLNLVGAVVCGLQRMMVRRSYVAASAKGWAALYVSEEEPGERKHPKIGERNTLTAQVWDSRLTAYVNGELVAKDSKFEWEINRSAPAQVGLGARGREAGDVAVVFHDVQVRALRELPSAPRRAAVTQ
jgi:tetratricopeptide (TPR) repeat protein